MSLLRGQAVIDDRYLAIADDAEIPSEGALLLGFERWQAERAALAGRDVGVRLPNTLDVTPHGSELAQLPLIACEFPSFADGRAYSQARKLRYLWGFTGVILAHGDVCRDQILWMSRVGFDALHMREDQDPVASLRAFSLYTEFYQY